MKSHKIPVIRLLLAVGLLATACSAIRSGELEIRVGGRGGDAFVDLRSLDSSLTNLFNITPIWGGESFGIGVGREWFL